MNIPTYMESKNSRFPCSSPQCNEVFDTISESQLHYKTYHCFQCKECNNIYYPNEYLLDLHIQETHDSYFQLAVEKYPERCHFQCLVLGCCIDESQRHESSNGSGISVSSMFHSQRERDEHLKEVHGYPNWFRFQSRRRRQKCVVDGMDVEGRSQIRTSSSSSIKKWWYTKRMNYSSTQPQLEEECDNNNAENDDKQLMIQDVIETTTRMDNHRKSLINQINHYQNKKKERKEQKKKATLISSMYILFGDGGVW